MRHAARAHAILRVVIAACACATVAAASQDPDATRIHELGAQLETASADGRKRALAELDACGDKAHDEIVRALQARAERELKALRTSAHRAELESLASARKRLDDARSKAKLALEGLASAAAESVATERLAASDAIQRLARVWNDGTLVGVPAKLRSTAEDVCWIRDLARKRSLALLDESALPEWLDALAIDRDALTLQTFCWNESERGVLTESAAIHEKNIERWIRRPDSNPFWPNSDELTLENRLDDTRAMLGLRRLEFSMRDCALKRAEDKPCESFDPSHTPTSFEFVAPRDIGDGELPPEVLVPLLSPGWISAGLTLHDSNLVLVFSTVSWAQETELRNQHDPWIGWNGTQFGLSVCALDDLDGDGAVDWAVASPSWPGGPQCEGRVLVYSGRTRALIHDLRGIGSCDGLASIDDLDGDGLRDLVIEGRTTTIRSSKSGEVLRAVEGRARWLASTNASGSRSDLFASCRDDSVYSIDLIELLPRGCHVRQANFAKGALWATADVNRDGVLDLLVGSGYPERATKVLSGSTGEVLLELNERKQELIAQPGEHLLFIGDPEYDGMSGGSMGRVIAFSLDRGIMLYARSMRDVDPEHIVKNIDEDDELGSSVLQLPDIDGDGIADVIAGAPACVWSSRVVAFSGAKGAVLWQHSEGMEADLGVSLAAIGDVDGDGVTDVLVGSVDYVDHGNWRPNGSVRGLSGKTGALLFKILEASVPK